MEKIIINGLKVFSYHGCMKEEEKIGGDFITDIELETNFIEAAKKDELRKTIDYTTVINIAREELLKRQDLIETVAFNILKALFSTFLKLEKVTIKITKKAPPVEGEVSSVSVFISKERSENLNL